jgi:Uma2 family endonuclease
VIDLLFGEGDYFEPDVIFVRAERAHVVGDRGIEAAPDLVTEILSPSIAHRDRGIELERYRHFGVPQYWIVDLEDRAVEIWRLADGVTAPDGRPEGTSFSWAPVGGGPGLDVRVADILP